MRKARTSGQVRAFCFPTTGYVEAKKIERRASIQRTRGISISETTKHSIRNTEERNEMTKLSAITAAFVLFAPVAVAILAQAAQIVA